MATEPSYFEPEGERGTAVQRQAGRRAQKGSAQANYLKRLERGDPLNENEVLAGKEFAAKMGWEFSADRGYSGGAPAGGGMAANLGTGDRRMGYGGNPNASDDSMRKPDPRAGMTSELMGGGGMSPAARDTARARSRTQTSVNVPADVRAINERGPRNAKEQQRLTDFWGSTAGRQIAEAGGGGGAPVGDGMPPEAGAPKQFAPSIAGGGDYAKTVGAAHGARADREMQGGFSDDELVARAQERDDKLTNEVAARQTEAANQRIMAARLRKQQGGDDMMAAEDPSGRKRNRMAGTKVMANLSGVS
jgi:hypothetical protein